MRPPIGPCGFTSNATPHTPPLTSLPQRHPFKPLLILWNPWGQQNYSILVAVLVPLLLMAYGHEQGFLEARLKTILVDLAICRFRQHNPNQSGDDVARSRTMQHKTVQDKTCPSKP